MGINAIDWYILFDSLKRKPCNFTEPYCLLFIPDAKFSSNGEKNYSISIKLNLDHIYIDIDVKSGKVDNYLFNKIVDFCNNAKIILNTPNVISNQPVNLFNKAIVNNNFTKLPNEFSEQFFIGGSSYMCYILEKGYPTHLEIVVRYREKEIPNTYIHNNTKEFNLFKRLYLECQNLIY